MAGMIGKDNNKNAKSKGKNIRQFEGWSIAANRLVVAWRFVAQDDRYL